MDNILDVQMEMERKRKELNLAGIIYDLQSDIMQTLSKELDELINKYNHFKSTAS
ncbi:MAG: aspartyl-phosphate phosphatase Spo0E family protein [Candidatus Pristimantibacillus sp.]